MNYRLNRLFNPTSGCCLDVAIDHGFFKRFTFFVLLFNEIEKNDHVADDYTD